MQRHTLDSEYTLPAEEYSLPPEIPETLRDQSRFAGAPGRDLRAPADPTVSETLQTAQPARETAEKAGAKRSLFRRSLLLQAAAVAASVVLVTSSFGLDFLGIDGLFNDSVLFEEFSEHSHGPFLPEDENVLPLGGDSRFPQISYTAPSEEGLIFFTMPSDLIDGVSGGFLRVSGSQGDPDADPHYQNSRYEELGLSYDRESNTLTMENFEGQSLTVQWMGSDFTIRLKGENSLKGELLVQCREGKNDCVTLTGNGSLKVNTGRYRETGLLMTGQGGKNCLMIGPDVSLDIYGGGNMPCLSVYGTTMEKPVYYLSERPVSGYWLRAEKEHGESPDGGNVWDLFESPPWSAAEHLRLRPRSGASADPDKSEGTLLPVGGDASFPEIPYSAAGLGCYVNYTYFSEDSGELVNNYYLSADYSGGYGAKVSSDVEKHEERGLHYDQESNTLTLDNFRGGAMIISGMGSDFSIHLKGENILTEELLFIAGEGTDDCVTITGSGYLALNTGRGTTHSALFLIGSGGRHCFLIGPDVRMDLYGNGERDLFQAFGTTMEKPIYYLSEKPVEGIVLSNEKGTDDEWPVWVLREEGTGNVAAHLSLRPNGGTDSDPYLITRPVGGDPVFPEIPHTAPALNQGDIYLYLNQYDENGELIVDYNVLDPGIHIYHVADYNEDDPRYYGYDDPDGLGITYDAQTNILTLRNCSARSLQVNGMGAEFTIRLEGQNELTGILRVDSYNEPGHIHHDAVTFTGDGYLAVNTARYGTQGLQLISPWGDGCIRIDSSVTMDIYGGQNQSAFYVMNGNSYKALVILSEKEMEGLYQSVFQLERNEARGYEYRWKLRDKDGDSVEHLHIGY
ncbi:MAG: hypothetical protein ILP12_04545 [Lachnospiraceae bacterium]|nr:hypothetical protein [Lachnospiraceae bacterium]